jgi:transcriptional regulator with GAF, ATPase, and Fis domain
MPEKPQDDETKTPALQDLKASLEELHRFKALLFELSAKFSSLSLVEVDREIDNGLQVIARFLGIDRAHLLELKEDDPEACVTHAYALPGIPTYIGLKGSSQFPWAFDRIRRGKVVKFSRAEEEIRKPTKDREFVIREGIRSLLAIPLKVSGSIVGALSFTTFRSQRSWPDELVRDLNLVGEVFANAILRKRAQVQIEELSRFEQLVSEISAKLVHLPAGSVEGGIEEGLGRIGEFLGVDWCCLAQVRPRGPAAMLSHVWMRQGAGCLPGTDTAMDLPWFIRRWLRNECVVFEDTEDLPAAAGKDRETLLASGIRSGLSVPLETDGNVIGALWMSTVRASRAWPANLNQRARLLGQIFANALSRKHREERLQEAYAEIKELKEQIEADCAYLREEIEVQHDFHHMIGRSEALLGTLAQIRTVAPTDVTVLVTGETGTGKELVARAIHEASRRRTRPLVKVDCAALPSSLIESELFGHEKGAFTGAHARRTGRFELAKGTTIFLDEIGELSPAVQTKLLRVLQEGAFERMGSSHTIRVDVRVIAASNKDLEAEVREGRFRKDLWYRLNVFPIRVPPLRERVQDIPLLVEWFVDKYGKKLGRRIKRIPESDLARLQAYEWPGNVRELENVIQRAVVNTRGSKLQLVENWDGHPGLGVSAEPEGSLGAVERAYIIRVLERTDWVVHGPRGAARILGLNPSTLRSRMKKLGIRNPNP